MAAKKTNEKLQLVDKNNELIQQLENSEYIKNPLVYSQIRGDFSLIQTNILVAIAATMQTRINERFVDGKLGPLFSKEELSKGKITFEVPLQSLGVKTKEYAAVHEACKALTKLDATFNYIDPETGQKITRYSVIFTDVDVPTYITTTGQERRSGIIKINMNAEVANEVFNKSGAYVEHLGGIVKLCRSPRTPRLYIYLSAWKKARMCTLGYEALKEFLGVLVYNKDRTKVMQDKCSTWAVFHRDVLKPAQREMEKLAKRGEIEFTFEYEPVYHNGKKRGNPDSVRFLLNPAVPDAQEVKEEKSSNSDVSHLTEEQQEKWLHFMELIQERIGEPFFSQYFVFCRVDSITDKDLTIVAPTKFVCEQIEKSGADFFITLKEVFGPVTLQYKVENPSYR
jgi:hypothetical protein